MLRAVGAVFVLVGILLLIIRNAAGSYLVDALAEGESAREAAGSSWIISTNLLAGCVGLIVCGVVMLLSALLAGPYAYARRVRGAIAPTLRDPRPRHLRPRRSPQADDARRAAPVSPR